MNYRFIMAQQNPYNPNKNEEVWAPEARLVNTGVDDKTPPSDAIILYDGSNYFGL
jgi:hypothetical protein